MMQKSVFLALILALSGCSVLDRDGAPPQSVAVGEPDPMSGLTTGPVAQRLPGMAGGQSAAALDTSTDAERSAALAVGPVAGAELGRVFVTLGNPTEQGFWLQTTLVSAPAKGRVQADGGASVGVELRPGAGGAQLSLAAFRALGLPLTGLPEVTVYSE